VHSRSLSVEWLAGLAVKTAALMSWGCQLWLAAPQVRESWPVATALASAMAKNVAAIVPWAALMLLPLSSEGGIGCP
jgi:hypothetical protein